jgi:hypothetical protein
VRPFFAILMIALLSCAGPGRADDQTIRAAAMTREQFEALSPDAVIEINGKRITKRELQARYQ